ncbi:MAG: ATP-binding protein [Elusimicrobia bacterium]|nr:ATP-binding protein [Elusimicrobiota bacterium]
MIFKREMEKKLAADLAGGRSILLLGPRQTGKTTLINKVCRNFPARLQYDLRLPSLKLSLENDPETIIREVKAFPGAKKPLIFIDEIQKVPALMDPLQYLLDNKLAVLIATGSSARKLRKGKMNWLPGRIKAEHFYPLTWGELGLAGGRPYAGLEENLLFGGLPGIMAERDIQARKEALAAYTALYLEEEIRQEAAVRRLPAFSRFLQLAALESGTSPNLSKLGAEVGVSHTSIHGYYQILEDSLITHRVDSYGGGRADVLRRSRYYFFDLGVRNSAAGIGHDRGILPLQAGVLFEHFVALELLAKNQGRYKVFYWRTKQGQEVDFVLERAGRILALEVKNTARPRPEDFKGLRAFRASSRCDGAYLVCNVERPQKFPEGIALPWRELETVTAPS